MHHVRVRANLRLITLQIGNVMRYQSRMTRLRSHRLKHKLTLQELAERVGCSKANLGRVEKRQQGASVDLVLALKRELNLSDADTIGVLEESVRDAKATP